MSIKITDVMEESGVKFGTSGVRGLVVDMTDRVCFIYVLAFLQHLKSSELVNVETKVAIAGDLRFSSPRIMNAAAAACVAMGFQPINCGRIPSPAVAGYGFRNSIPSIMVTGSHIPDDRNGIKFNTPFGEILKPDEEAIRSQLVTIDDSLFDEQGMLLKQNYLGDLQSDAEQHYIERFINFFPENALVGKNIGLYEHSSVGRDCLKNILEQLGASVTSLGRSDVFISVDTEAIRPEDVTLAKHWAKEGDYDCLISTDGDADRPLVGDENGNWLRGDLAGVLCARYLGADRVVTPVSSNTAVEKSEFFENVERTRIGSPFVIDAMQRLQAENSDKNVVGYEANGGFLQQTTINQNGEELAPLPTRDAAIVPLTILMLAKESNCTISELLATLPERYTHSDRVKEFPTELSQNLLARLMAGSLEDSLTMIADMLPHLPRAVSIDSTDGVRITLDDGDIVHLRPSGNAPEFRCYAESASEEKAKQLCESTLEVIVGLKNTFDL